MVDNEQLNKFMFGRTQTKLMDAVDENFDSSLSVKDRVSSAGKVSNNLLDVSGQRVKEEPDIESAN